MMARTQPASLLIVTTISLSLIVLMMKIPTTNAFSSPLKTISRTLFSSHTSKPSFFFETSPRQPFHHFSTLQNSQNPPLKPDINGVYTVSSMPPPLPSPLQNSYYLLRHGQSEGNVEGVISSSRSLANSTKHGLTSLGWEQGRASAKKLLDVIRENNDDDDDGGKRRVFFYSSPFARAKQTAEACLGELGELGGDVDDLGLDVQEDIILEDGLMERYFGRLDFDKIHTYAYVWPVDMFDVTHTAFNVESVAAVSHRLRETILSLDNRHNGDIVVLVSHADVLQIMQLYAAGMENVGMFSQYRFGNGEVRFMGRNGLPEAVPLQPPKRGT